MNEELMARCSCAHCGNHLQFPIDGAGLTISCPHCGQPTELNLVAPPATPPGHPSIAELLAGFQGTIPRTRTSFFYQVGLLLVAIVMVVLPLIYLCLIAAAAWGLYYYATHCSSVLNPVGGGSRLYLIQLLLYLGPLCIGAILVVFMVKPLFARRPREAQPLALNPGAEPTLYAFIARICEIVGAPMPKRIDLDCELNASAGFRRGFLSMFGHDLVLTIGLPLAGGLTLSEFAGVIAHEFGHFTQGFGLRLSYLIYRINGWFERVVYERDTLDMWLAGQSEDSEDWPIMLITGCARLAVGFSRLLLLLLMQVGKGVSCFLMRQMEYDADRYAIQLVGSTTCESTRRRMAVLQAAMELAYKHMEHGWKHKQELPTNFPEYLVHHHSRFTPAQRQQVEDSFGLEKTGLFDTHPSMGDRIRRARQAAAPGIFHLDLPATVLFSNFGAVSQQVTLLHYADDLGIDFDPAMLAEPARTGPPQAS